MPPKKPEGFSYNPDDYSEPRVSGALGKEEPKPAQLKPKDHSTTSEEKPVLLTDENNPDIDAILGN